MRIGAHVHVAGTAARGEALAGDAYAQTQDILGTVCSALDAVIDEAQTPPGE